VADANTLFLGSFEVNIDVTLGIDHYGFAIRSQHVRCMSQAAKIKLLEVHVSPPAAAYVSTSGNRGPLQTMNHELKGGLIMENVVGRQQNPSQ
jgi:hypothetical protein